MRNRVTSASRRKPLAILASLFVLAATLVGVAPSASAATTVTLTVGNGKVGVTQPISASVGADAPAGQMDFIVGGATIASNPIGGPDGPTVSNNWNPSKAGSITMQARFTPRDGSAAASTSKTVSISKVRTKVQISVPGNASAGETIQLVATVKASEGDYSPTGSVSFLSSSGSSIGKAALQGGTAVMDYALPSKTGTVTFYASYGGDAGSEGARSESGSVKVAGQSTPSSGSTVVKIEVPATFAVNQVVDVTVRITPATTGGTVTYTVGNGKPGTPKAVVNGVVTSKWKLSKPGTYRLTAKYSGSGSVRPGQATATVRVVAQTNIDKITVTRDGDPNPWSTEGVTTLTNGADAVLNATAASGAAVTLAIEGPCTLNANVLHVNGVGGTCRLVATSPGGNGFDATSAAYTVATAAGAQTATVNPPADDSYPKGSLLKLAPVAARTNVGQPIIWYVDKGPKVCKVIRKGGWFRVEMRKKGACTVMGVAPPISDQWSEFRVTRNYTVIPNA